MAFQYWSVYLVSLHFEWTVVLKKKAEVENSALDRLQKCFEEWDIDIPSLFSSDNQGNAKRKWEDSEVCAIERCMMCFIHTCKVPQKIDCMWYINTEPYALKDRTLTGVKNYIRNRIAALKRGLCPGLTTAIGALPLNGNSMFFTGLLQYTCLLKYTCYLNLFLNKW